MKNQRIIFVPQFPSMMRYQEWWMWEFPLKFVNAGFEVVTLGNMNSRNIQPNYGYKIGSKNFSPIESAISFEMSQIQEYMDLKLRDDDIIFLADLSFPGFFANALHHKRTKQMYAFCHATSLNDYDYFQQVRHSKFQVERGQANMFEKVFVGSRYHLDKLNCVDWPNNLVITGLPEPPKSIISPVSTKKKWFLMSASRPSIQKVDPEIEDDVEKQYRTKIYRGNFKSWKSYCRALSESKVLLVTAREETFGYQVVDAIINGCIPVVPNAFSYTEMVPREYRYDNTTELMNILDGILGERVEVPELLCKARIKNFFPNIIKILRKEGDSYPF